MQKKLLIIIVQMLLIFIVVPDLLVLAQKNIPVAEWEPPMQIPSPDSTSSWFPDIAIDHDNRVHIVWSESGDFGLGDTLIERAYYIVWDNSQWSLYNDIAPAQQDIIRTAIVNDDYDILHLVLDSYPPFSLNYKKAHSSDAFSAANWTEPFMVNEGYFTYMSDIVSFQDTLHIIYDDEGVIDDQCENCADIYYRRSEDSGKSWLPPITLRPSGTGSSRGQIIVDSSGALYVSWDEGWDRLTGKGEPLYGVFVYSKNQGETWSSPLIIDYPQNNNAQLTVGSNGSGGIMLVWRTISDRFPGIYYSWSEDWGNNWSNPQTLPDMIARDYINPFDVYSMATDSNGSIHLLVVGHLSSSELSSPIRDQPPGLYHFMWDGTSWSDPISVYNGSWFPEYPHLAISQGNQLHAVWFLRQDPFSPNSPHQIWYSSTSLSAPMIIQTVKPNPSETASGNSEIRADTQIVSTPTSEKHDWQESGQRYSFEELYTEIDELTLLGISIIPALLITGSVLLIFRLRRR